MYENIALFIGGRWTTPDSADLTEVISPHTEDVIGSVATAGPSDVDTAVRSAREAVDHGPWPKLAPAQRIAAINRFAELYAARRAEMAEIISAEMGAPMSFAKRAQVRLPMALMSAMCVAAESFPWSEERPGFYGNTIRIDRHPVGVVAAVVPWNMPQFLSLGKIVPALLAGCSVVLKPAPETPLDAHLLAELVEEADLPTGVFSVLPGDAVTGAALIGHPGVDKVSFTGSTAAGRQVAATAAQNLTPVSLELGGKSAAIILDDADPGTTAAAIRAASLANSGQVCNALTRILVPESRKSEHIAALANELDALTVGDPSDPGTEIGPLVSRRQQSRVREYICRGQEEGARLVTGGSGMPEGLDRGWYVRPTLFVDADNRMAIAREEIFGPVLTCISYRNEEEAISIADDSEYGLAGAVFTTDEAHGYEVAARIHSGSFGINQGYIMDPLAPFGGVKNSGYGRELGSEGIAGYTSSQSISVAPTAAAPGAVKSA